MPAPCFFGYGSLVNRDTHTYPNASLAQLNGWRRVWRHTDWHATAFLSVHRVEGAQIDGLIAEVPGADWQALDAREGGYQRHPASSNINHSLSPDTDIAVYVVAGDWAADHLRPKPILLSYIDVVTQGYLREYGPKGADHFFATTDGWDIDVLNDRAAPIYPRSQVLSRDEVACVDGHLAQLPVRFVTQF